MSPRFRRLVLLSTVWLSAPACADKTPAAPPAPAPSPASADTVEACRARVRAFETWTRRVQERPSTGALMPTAGLLALAPVGSADPWAETIVVEIGTNRFAIEGEELAGDALVDTLGRHAKRIDQIAAASGGGLGGRRAPPEPRGLTLAIAPDAPWAAVVTVADAAAATGFGWVQLAFAYPGGEIAAPGPSAVDDELRKLWEASDGDVDGPSRGAVVARAARMTERLVKGCTSPAPSAVASPADCRCALDYEALRAVTWQVSRPDTVWAARRTVSTTGADLALPASMPWREAHPRVLGWPQGLAARLIVQK